MTRTPTLALLLLASCATAPKAPPLPGLTLASITPIESAFTFGDPPPRISDSAFDAVDSSDPKPERWLAAVANRKLLDHARHERLRARPDIVGALASVEQAEEPSPFPDDRLRLMLVCAHPAIDAAIRPALVLQTVLGLEVKVIAPAFLLSAETLNKRLVRAKAKIRQAGVPFEDPEPQDLPERVEALLEALYAAYFIGREGTLAAGDDRDELRDEALSVLRVIGEKLPNDPEVAGPLALVLFCEARRPAQSTPDGQFVPLLQQDTTKWDPRLLREAYETLGRAARLGREGPFQIEAAIQAAHCYRARSGEVPWSDIVALYEKLITSHSTIGATVGMAVATAHADRSPERGLALLLGVDSKRVESYQPWWVALAHLYEMERTYDTWVRAALREDVPDLQGIPWQQVDIPVESANKQ